MKISKRIPIEDAYAVLGGRLHPSQYDEGTTVEIGCDKMGFYLIDPLGNRCKLSESSYFNLIGKDRRGKRESKESNHICQRIRRKFH